MHSPWLTPYDAGFIAASWLVPAWFNPWPYLLIGSHEAWALGHHDALQGWRPRRGRPLLELLQGGRRDA